MEAQVRGYKLSEAIVAIEVKLDGGKAIKLRDAEGRPLWRRHGGHGKGWGP